MIEQRRKNRTMNAESSSHTAAVLSPIALANRIALPSPVGAVAPVSRPSYMGCAVIQTLSYSPIWSRKLSVLTQSL